MISDGAKRLLLLGHKWGTITYERARWSGSQAGPSPASMTQVPHCWESQQWGTCVMHAGEGRAGWCGME